MRLSVVRSKLRLRDSGLSRERRRRVPAHPLEYDQRGVASQSTRRRLLDRAPGTARDPLTGEPTKPSP